MGGGGLDFDTIVAGGGVIGLAVGRALAQRGQSVLVVEAEDAVALHQSSRNSEVIHAGIYYPAGSLKARMCLAGKDRLYAYARDRGIRAEAIGKLIVATATDEVATLERIRTAASAAGLDALEALDGAAVRRMEPELNAVAALWSPTTGIIDSRSYILALQGDLEAAGGSVICRARVIAVRRGRGCYDVEVQSPDGAVTLRAAAFVNAAGLWAPAVAATIEGYPTAAIPASGLARGCYFSLAGRAPFRHLVYPVPVPGALGTHLTLDLAGQARFGPDIEWIDSVDYRVDPGRAASFYDAIRRYWPGLPDQALTPAFAGIRAKIGPRDCTQDFELAAEDGHGLPGVLCLFGIESPGLTSSLALADLAADRLGAG